MKRPQEVLTETERNGKQFRASGTSTTTLTIGSSSSSQTTAAPLSLNLQAHDTAMDEMEEGDDDGDSSDGENDDDDDSLLDTMSFQELCQALHSRSGHFRIKVLRVLSGRIEEWTPAERTRLQKICQRNLYTEESKGVKISIVQLLQRIIETTTVDTRSIIEDFLTQIHADSTEVRVQVYDSISQVARLNRLSIDTDSGINTIRALLTNAIAELTDRHHRVRSAVLQLLSQLAPLLRRASKQSADLKQQLASISGYSQNDLQLIISNYVTDPEPRVRKNALKALLELHAHGFKLALVLYDTTIHALADDYQEVRMEGLDLIIILATLYPNLMVQNPLTPDIHASRLVDDAFVRICDMVNDSSMVVRAKACSSLGQFKTVDYKYLSQTFSKQVMQQGKVNKVARDLAAGPAQKQAQRAKLIATPEGDQDVTGGQMRLLDSGACGAFVHGLEDEYQDVRSAAINSICQLALHNEEFAVLSLDYMVDMFMDEIDHVRMNALTSLRKISNRATISFDTEQLQIALGVLEDADRDVRECAHGMLQVITIATANGMDSFLTSVSTNLARFPEDQISVYHCIKAVGRRHGTFVADLVPTILNLNREFSSIEGNSEDALYGANLILIFSAAVSNPSILNILPKYAFKHYTYLRDKYPNCFPEPHEIPCQGTQSLRDLSAALTLTLASDHRMDESLDTSHTGNGADLAASLEMLKEKTLQDANAFYLQVMEAVQKVQVLMSQSPTSSASSSVAARARINATTTMIQQQIKVCRRNLRYIMDVHVSQAWNAEFVSLYLQCCDLLMQIKSSVGLPSFIIRAPVLAAQIFRLSYTMDNMFVGLDPTVKIAIGYFRVLANLVWFFGMVQTSKDPTLTGSSFGNPKTKAAATKTRENIQEMLRLAIKRITDLQQQMDRPEVDQERIRHHRVLLGDLRVAVSRAYNNPSTFGIVTLMTSIVNFTPMAIDFSSLELQRMDAEITLPKPNRDNPLEIHPRFPFLIPIEGLIQRVQEHDPTGISVQVTLPNGSIREYYPPAEHFLLQEEENSTMGLGSTSLPAITPSNASLEKEKQTNSNGKGKAKDHGHEEHNLESEDEGDVDMESRSQPETARLRTYRLRTSIEIYPEESWGNVAADLRITLSRAFQPDLVGHDEFICRYGEEVEYQDRQQIAGSGALSLSSSSTASLSNSLATTSAAGAVPVGGSRPLGSVVASGSSRGSSAEGTSSTGQGSSTSLALIATNGGRIVEAPGHSDSLVESHSTLGLSKSVVYVVSRKLMFASAQM